MEKRSKKSTKKAEVKKEVEIQELKKQETKKGNGKAKKEKKPGKAQKIRDMFEEKDSWTIDELIKRSGFDLRNLRTCMTILRNPARTKNLLITDYNKETKSFILQKN